MLFFLDCIINSEDYKNTSSSQMSHYHFVEIRARAYNTINDYVLNVYIKVNWAQDKNPSFSREKTHIN